MSKILYTEAQTPSNHFKLNQVVYTLRSAEKPTYRQKQSLLSSLESSRDLDPFSVVSSAFFRSWAFLLICFFPLLLPRYLCRTRSTLVRLLRAWQRLTVLHLAAPSIPKFFSLVKFFRKTFYHLYLAVAVHEMLTLIIIASLALPRPLVFLASAISLHRVHTTTFFSLFF